MERLSGGVLGIFSSIGDISSVGIFSNVGIFSSVGYYQKCGRIFSIVKGYLLEV